MEKEFLIVTAVTPERLQTPLRKKLFSLYKRSLLEQTYTNWKVLLLGEEEGTDGKFIKIKCDVEWKIPKLQKALDHIKDLPKKPAYVLRLDDDDLISPLILEAAAQKDFDCFADEAHHFYDLVYSSYCSQKRPWLANTIIHKTDHLFYEFGKEKIPLFMKNHNEAWHLYYSDKNIVFTNRKNPLYIRTLAPITFSITGFDEGKGLQSRDSINWNEYNQHLHTFGIWKKQLPDFLSSYSPALHEISLDLHAPSREKLPFFSLLKKLLKR